MNYFKHAYCINLDSRPDKWRKSKKKFEKLKLKVKRFPAIDGIKLSGNKVNRYLKRYDDRINNQRIEDILGIIGCTKSKEYLLKYSLKKKFDCVCLFEDDVSFHKNFKHLFNLYISEVPNNWDVIMLGAIHIKEPEKITEHVCKCKYVWCSHAMIFRRSMFKKYLKQLIKLSAESDIALNKLIRNGLNVYSFNPQLAIQAIDYSDIRKKIRSPYFDNETGELIENYGLYDENDYF